MLEIPDIRVLESIRPKNLGTGEATLVYEGLAAAIDKYQLTNNIRWSRFFESEPGSLDELSDARQLASEYLLRTSERAILSSAGSHDLWASRFTQASIELYGAPDPKEASRLLADEYDQLVGLQGREYISQEHVRFLLDTYRPLVGSQDPADHISAEAESEGETNAVRAYGAAIREEYQPLFDLVDVTGKTEFRPDDLKELFEQALTWMKDNDDEAWGEWRVVSTNGTTVSVGASDREVHIPNRREAASVDEARGLLAHELLVHGLRGKNGSQTGDKKLGSGLPEYLDAEEGLGILNEMAINGKLPDKAYDRYVDIALALGTVNGVQRDRPELFRISYARQLIRGQLNGQHEVDTALAAKVWTHVDRIYRGGRGDIYGTRQAIFTKDIAYYTGYKQMAKYITSQLAEGKTAGEIFHYLSQGKFDPLNPQHAKRLEAAIEHTPSEHGN